MAVAGSLKLTLFLSDIRSRNNSADSPLILHGQFPSNLTAAIQVGKIKCLFISTDLHYRIRRSIDNHRSCIDFFLTKFLDDFCSTGTLISNHTLATSLFQFIDQFFRKTCFCKSNKRLLCIDSHHFPVACHCILSIAGLPNSHIAANRIFHAFHRTTLMQIQHSKFLKIWNIQSSHLIQDMSERIHTLIAKFLRIRHCSNPQ